MIVSNRCQKNDSPSSVTMPPISSTRQRHMAHTWTAKALFVARARLLKFIYNISLYISGHRIARENQHWPCKNHYIFGSVQTQRPNVPVRLPTKSSNWTITWATRPRNTVRHNNTRALVLRPISKMGLCTDVFFFYYFGDILEIILFLTVFFRTNTTRNRYDYFRCAAKRVPPVYSVPWLGPVLAAIRLCCCKRVATFSYGLDGQVAPANASTVFGWPANYASCTDWAVMKWPPSTMVTNSQWAQSANAIGINIWVC